MPAKEFQRAVHETLPILTLDSLSNAAESVEQMRTRLCDHPLSKLWPDFNFSIFFLFQKNTATSLTHL